MRQWNETVRHHENAAAEYAAAAAAVTEWNEPRSAGKWTPARITAHLNLSFEAVLREACGGAPMALRTTRFQRMLLRYTIQRRLMRGGPFPQGAPAPRETRPPELTHASASEQAEALQVLRRLAGEVIQALDVALKKNPDLRFRHPYFGSMPAVDGLYISARHIEHHRAQLDNR